MDIRKYFKKKLKQDMWKLEINDPVVFYLSAWQKNQSLVPLLLLRLFLFLISLSLLVASIVDSILNDNHWGIYLTDWGVIMYVLTTGFGVFISTHGLVFGCTVNESPTPWFIKIYWMLYNIVIPLAFNISIVYWTLMNIEPGHQAPTTAYASTVLNSVVIFLLLMVSAHPTRLLHFIQPLLFIIVFILFSLIYYVCDCGIKNVDGDYYVYPALDWSRPWYTVIVCIAATGLVVILHILTAALAELRDYLSKQCIKRPTDIPNTVQQI